MNEEIFSVMRMGLRLATVKRALYRPDGRPESTTDHSVSLTWLACSLARAWYPELDLGLVAQFCIAHDAVEVYAPDTPVMKAGDEGRKTQKKQEAESLARIENDLPELDWLPRVIAEYEQQACPEARFVKLADRIAGKLVSCIDGKVAERAREQGVTQEDIRSFREWEGALFGGLNHFYFPEMDELRQELNDLEDSL